MRSLLIITVLLVNSLFVPAQQKEDWAGFSRYEEANKTAPKESVVFMGNSITEGWVNTHPHFFSDNHYLGRGISGQTSMQMLVRFRRDVIDLQPKAVVILAGTNDIAQNTGYISLNNILGDLISMVELAQTNHINVILCSVLPAYEFGWRKELKPADDIIKLNQLIKDYALQHRIPYVDYHSALKDARNGLSEKYAKDGVHPTAAGYDMMEGLVKPVIDKVVKSKNKP
ncbi:SGNH/GDSL hydrolase family protein [Olivibacter ginsenosidimutans]|uniref:SGNH/GDSL hydrolase family protein n=1 Tax=Olivibacter ginsenosidimutans TaxID=1176537 RepID=A0ABP9AXX3_9SPHI